MSFVKKSLATILQGGLRQPQPANLNMHPLTQTLQTAPAPEQEDATTALRNSSFNGQEITQQTYAATQDNDDVM